MDIPEFFAPQAVDAELPQEIKDAHAGFAGRLLEVQRRQQKNAQECKRSKEKLGATFDLKGLENVRKAGALGVKLLREESEIRGEFSAWLATTYRSAIESLEHSLAELLEAEKRSVREKMAGIGFTFAAEPTIDVGLEAHLRIVLSRHDAVSDVAARHSRICSLWEVMSGAQQDGSPIRLNSDRMKALAQQIGDASKRNEQFLALL